MFSIFISIIIFIRRWTEKIISHYCSYASKKENCYVPGYSDDMKVSYEAAMTSIATLISTDDASFANKLHEEYTNLCNLDVCDYSDVMVLSVTYSYLKDTCIEEVKKLLNSIKIYLNTVYNFIKNM